MARFRNPATGEIIDTGGNDDGLTEDEERNAREGLGANDPPAGGGGGDSGLTEGEERNAREGLGAGPDSDDDGVTDPGYEPPDRDRDDDSSDSDPFRDVRDQTRRDVASGGGGTSQQPQQTEQTPTPDNEQMSREPPTANARARVDLGTDRQLSQDEARQLFQQADVSNFDDADVAVAIQDDEAVLFTGPQAEQRAAFETERTLRGRISSQFDEVSPGDVEVTQTGDEFTATLSEDAQRRVAISRVAAENPTLDPDELTARLDESGDIVVELTEAEMDERQQRLDNALQTPDAAATAARAQRQNQEEARLDDVEATLRSGVFDDMAAAGIEQTTQVSDTNAANSLIEAEQYNQAIREAADQSGIEFSELAENPVEFLRGAGQERQEQFINELTGGLQERLAEQEDAFFADLTPGEERVTQQDVARGIRENLAENQKEVAGLAALGVAAPEPATTAGGLIVLGGLAAGAAIASNEIEVPTQRERRPDEIEVPTDGEGGMAEIPTPTEAFEENQVNEIPVNREAVEQDSEIDVPDRTEDEFDLTIRAAQAQQQQREEEEAEEDEEEEEEEDEEEEEERVRVNVPSEMIPEETVTIGGSIDQNAATETELPNDGRVEEDEEIEDGDSDVEVIERQRQGQIAEDAEPDDVEVVEDDRPASVTDDAAAVEVLTDAFSRVEAAAESIGGSGDSPIGDVFAGVDERAGAELDLGTVDADASAAAGDIESPALDGDVDVGLDDIARFDRGLGADVAATPTVDTVALTALDTQLSLRRDVGSYSASSSVTTSPVESNLNLTEPTVPEVAFASPTGRGRRGRIRPDTDPFDDDGMMDLDLSGFDTEATAPIADAGDAAGVEVGEVELDLGGLD